MIINNKLALLLIALFTSIFSFSQGFDKMSQEELNEIPLYSKSTFGFGEDLPSSYSIEEYVPNVGSQRQSGSCVAWAFSYYGMSTIYNRKYGIRSVAGKRAHAFDPWFLFNQISYLDEDTCANGVNELEILRISNRIGNKKMLFSPMNIDCETDWEDISLKSVVEYTKPYRFIDWEQINASEDSNSVDKVKSEISKYEYPVMIGISRYGKGLDKLYNDTNGIFKPNYDDEIYDGHMMTIVGYDDNINGGSFRVVNSWGKDWGDKGYMWMSYNDYRRYTDTTFTVYVSFDSGETNGTELNIGNYKTINLSSNNNIRYEGIVNNQGDFNGEGVLYRTNENNEYEYVVGTWKNGVKDGFFLAINGDDWWYSCYENGNQLENCKSNPYGFASSSSNKFNNIVDDLEIFSDKFFNETNIKSKNKQ